MKKIQKSRSESPRSPQSKDKSRAPAGRDEQPKRRAPADRDEQPKRRAPAGRDEQPKRRAPAGRDEQPKRRAPADRDEQPKRRAPSSRDEQPKRRAPAGRDEQPKRRPSQDSGPDFAPSRPAPAQPVKENRGLVQKPRRSHQTGREGLFINNWSALTEYLKAQPTALQKIFHAPREGKRIREALAEHGVSLSCEEDAEMETGFAAQVTILYADEEQLLQDAAARTDDLIIACDHVTDTRNLGAIARTAAFFGVSTLLMPKDRQAPITSATLGTAQGAFATVTPTEVTNLGRTLLALKDCGYWIASADMVGMPVDKMPTRYEKLVLVLGSEDKGVSAQILSKSDFTLSIPSFGGKLESLNVSVAAGILIHALRAFSAPGKILPQG